MAGAASPVAACNPTSRRSRSGEGWTPAATGGTAPATPRPPPARSPTISASARSIQSPPPCARPIYYHRAFYNQELLDFIRTIVSEDLAAGRNGGRVATRFP